MRARLLLCALSAAAAAVWAPALPASAQAAAARAAPERPNLEGVWVTYPGSDPVAFGFGTPKALPFRPQAQAKVDEFQRLTARDKDNPAAFCLGWGMPASMLFSGGFPMEIIPDTDQITIIYEALGEIRRIYFGDKVIPPEDRLPDRNGYSIGRWEGDTLVVETTSLVEQVDQQYAHSSEAKIVERYSVITDGNGDRVLVNDWTLTDPAFYIEPVSAQKKWAFNPKGRLLPYQCREQEWDDHLARLKGGVTTASP